MAIYFVASRLDRAAALLTFGPGSAIAVAAKATATTTPPPAALTVAVLAVTAFALFAPLLSIGILLAATLAAIAAAAATASTAVAIAAITAETVIAALFALGAGGRSRLLAAEQALQPAEETAGRFRRLGRRGAFHRRLRGPRFKFTVVAPRFAGRAGLKSP